MEGESKILGVSMRGWLACILVTTVCVLAFGFPEMRKAAENMALIAVGFYFGQKGQK